MNSSYKSQKSHTSHKSQRIAFVGGGTAGHILPNIAIINELKNISVENGVALDMVYIGRANKSEKSFFINAIDDKKIKYKGILSGKLRRYFDLRNFSDIVLILLGFFQSLFFLIFNRPKIVFAKGGFVTVPFCLACVILRIPFTIHESDTVLGLSNRILLPFARKIYLGFPIEAYSQKLPENKIFFSGNPVKSVVFEKDFSREKFCKQYNLDPKKKIIFVFGGSQGSQAINRLLKSIIENLVDKYILIHSTGMASEEEFKKFKIGLNKKEQENYRVFGFIGEEKNDFLNGADLVISRGGANSIAEIIVVKKPAIIIPLPSAASNHQKINADFLQSKGVASVLEEGFLTSQKLFEEIELLIGDKKTRNSMIKNMESIFPENSGSVIAKDILAVING